MEILKKWSNLKSKAMHTGIMSKTKQIDSPPLSDEEIRDIEEFYNHPKDHKVGTLTELLDELHSD